MLNFMQGRAAQTQTGARRLNAQDIVKLAEAGQITVIDVRDHNELAMSGKAKGALHIPLATLRFQADPSGPDFHPDLDTSAPVAVYCASGARSNMAMQMLQAMGYGEVHNIGGLGHWHMAGGEIERV